MQRDARPSATSTVVVNTRRLLDHLLGDYPHLGRARASLRAGLPRGRRPRRPARGGDGKRRFFFYSRPENARNLFWRGGQRDRRGPSRTTSSTPTCGSFHFVGRRDARPDAPARRQAAGRRGARLARLPGAGGHDGRRARADGHPPPVVPAPTTSPPPAPPCSPTAPRQGGPLRTSRANILIADPASTSLVEGLARVAALGLDDAQRAATTASRPHRARLGRGADRRRRRARRPVGVQRLGRAVDVH